MLTKDRIEELANKCLAGGNPYIKRAIIYYIDNQIRYIFNDVIFTKEQLDAEYLATAKKDIKRGYEERMIGYYDKWYRYSRADEGRAYDMGVKDAVAQPKCADNLTIIPCIN